MKIERGWPFFTVFSMDPTYQLCVQLMRDKKYAEALPLIEQFADSGDAKMQNMLGVIYESDELQDYALAIHWYTKAAKQGFRVSQRHLGRLYWTGNECIRQNQAMAMAWYTESANQGDSTAQANLGTIYMMDVAVPHDYTLAVNWLKKAADQGNVTAQTNLSIIYFKDSKLRNYELAVYWVKKAVEQGNTIAMFMLGQAYAKGWGIEVDNYQAAKYLTAASEKGNLKAKIELEKLGRTPGFIEQLVNRVETAERTKYEIGTVAAHTAAFKEELALCTDD